MIRSDKMIYKSRAWSILANSFKQNRYASTYLITGDEGVGRWLCGIAFTALLNCEDVQQGDDRSYPQPCGSCRNCHNIFNLSFSGLKLVVPIPPHENKLDKAMELTAEYIEEKRQEPFHILKSKRSTNIPIALTREIKKSLNLKAEANSVRVVMIYQMERMNLISADALLKMIEEPPENTVIILISNKPDSLPQTIQSRAQKIRMDRLNSDDIASYLADHYQLTDSKAGLFSNIAEGSMGRAIELCHLFDDDSKARRSEMFLLFKSLVTEDGSDTLAHMNDLLTLRDRSETEELLRLWQSLIKDCAGYAISNDESAIINSDFKVEIITLSASFTLASRTTELLADIKITLADLKRNVHIQGALMALALKLKKIVQTA